METSVQAARYAMRTAALTCFYRFAFARARVHKAVRWILQASRADSRICAEPPVYNRLQRK